MNKILAALALICAFTPAKSQKKDFEGRLTYQVTTKSKSTDYDDNFYKLLLAANGDRLIVTLKNEMIKQTLGLSDIWYMGKSKKVYVKIKNIDTLYFRDYSSDSSKVTDIIKSESVSIIQGLPCKSITLKRENSTSRILYTDALQFNTEYEKDNTLDNLNVLIRETGTAMWLYYKTDYKGASITDSCLHVDQSPVDDQIFDLPALPQKNLSGASLVRIARFRGGENVWMRYLKNNLNSSVSVRYIKIPKGEKDASVKVLVRFIVSEDGSVSNIEVTNKGDVDSHLANEAMRVIRESPPWEAATIYGVKTKMSVSQPIVFSLTK
jgi:TonB family protein